MAYDIGPKIGIEGEKEFRKAIRDINNNMRTLGTEMGVVTSQFDKNDNSIEAVNAKNKVLNKQIDKQKEKLEQLTKGLEQSSEKYGENDRVTEGWKQSVNKATADLNKMERELKNNTKSLDGFGDEIEDVNKKGGKFSGMLGGMTNGLKKVGGTVAKGAVIGLKSVGIATAAAGVGALKLARDVGKAADDLITLSNQTGISTEQLQEWDYAMRFIDVPMETMTGSLSKLTKNMDNAGKGAKDQTEAFQRLGVSFRDDVTGELRNNKVVFEDLIDALGDIENETERDALAMRLFGKSAKELNPLIKAGGDELARLSEEAHNVGAVLSDETLKAAGDFDDQMQVLEASSKGLVGTLGVAVIPVISEIVNSVVGVVPKITKAIKTGDWESAGQAVSEGINGLLSKVTGALPGLTQMASTIIGGLATSIVIAIPEILPPLIDATLMLLDTLIEIIIENGPMLIDAGIEALMMIVSGLIEALPRIIEASMLIIFAITNGLTEALPQLIGMVPQIIDAIVITLSQNLPLIINIGLQIIMALGKSLITNIPTILVSVVKIIAAILKGLLDGIAEIVSFVPKLFKEMVSAFKDINWSDLGKNIISGIGSGVKDSAKGLADSVGNAASGALSWSKKKLGISSPSKVFKNEVGKMIGLGMAEGISDSARQVEGAMSGLNKKLNVDVGTFGARSIQNNSGSSMVLVNVPVNLDGKMITKATNRVQIGNNKGRSRALGVII